MSRPAEINRAQLMDAARAVMMQKGYQGFTMGEVAKQAGCAAGTLYLYFQDKMDLFAGVFVDLLDRIDARLETSLKGKTGLDKLRALVFEILSFMDDHHEFLSEFMGEQEGLSRMESGQKLRERYGRHLAIISDCLKECIDQGIVRPHDLTEGSLYLSLLPRMFMYRNVLSKSPTPLKSKAEDMLALYLNGLGKRTP